MKNLRPLCLVVAFAASANGTEDFFPVMPWNHVPHDTNVIAKIRECGFTVAGFANPGTLKLCEQNGLKAIVYDARTASYDWTNVDEAQARKNVRSLVDETGQSKAAYGYYLRDEPRGNFFKGLAIVSSLVQEMAPGKWPYINLFPNYAEPWQMDAEKYDAYVEKFVKICRPTQLSYDHYALMDDGSLRGSYWQNLEQMRAAAVRHQLPFWNIVLATAHFNYREPTAADMRFQVYSTLAYGGRGISYFTYFAPQVGNYRNAPIDQFGNPTPAWGVLQNINLQIQKLAPTLLKLKSDAVYHFGAIPQGCHGPETNSLVSAIGGEIAAGDFTHEDGNRYVMLVNKDLIKSVHCAPQFRSPQKSLKFVCPYSGQLLNYEGEYLWLAPGGGRLLKLE